MTKTTRTWEKGKLSSRQDKSLAFSPFSLAFVVHHADCAENLVNDKLSFRPTLRYVNNIFTTRWLFMIFFLLLILSLLFMLIFILFSFVCIEKSKIWNKLFIFSPQSYIFSHCRLGSRPTPHHQCGLLWYLPKTSFQQNKSQVCSQSRKFRCCSSESRHAVCGVCLKLFCLCEVNTRSAPSTDQCTIEIQADITRMFSWIFSGIPDDSWSLPQVSGING